MKQQFLFTSIIFLTIFSCSSSKQVSDNHLSKKEKNDGYILLFDGKTMNGWRDYKNIPSNVWSVNDNALHCGGSGTQVDLITNDEYENFDLSIDYKIAPKSNSGILYMVTEEFPSTYLSGPEYQIIDDKGYPEKLETWQMTAANYAMDAAPDAAPNAPGEWNHARIVVNHGHVEHWLNGKKVVEYELWTDEWKKKKMAGKWKDAPGYGLSKKGHIALQDHGDNVSFKNIKIKVL